MSRWLPTALAALGHDVRVFVPNYDVMEAGDDAILPVTGLDRLDLGGLGDITVSTVGEARSGAPTLCLVGSDRWFDRGVVYDSAGDDHLRFAALARAAIAACDASGWIPDVLHAHDWHTALLARFAAAAGGDWSTIPTVLTIHNLAHQGVFSGTDLEVMGLDPTTGPVNSLRAGIEDSAMVTTVSPTFAAETLTPEQGMGLDAELRSLGDRYVGILNGIGDDWNPATDPWISLPYSEPSGKATNTAALRARMRLTPARGVPVVGIVSRLDPQKGFDLLRTTIPPLLAAGSIQLAVLGRGDTALEEMFASFAARFPGLAAFESGFDRGLGHVVEAGSDMFLMPSRFEPCGLNQMYSMKYGTVPIVHRTGGLADTVTQWDPASGTGTGFVFEPFDVDAFAESLRAALEVFADRSAWVRLMANGMGGDYSWHLRSREYEAVYGRAMELGPRQIL